jgi:hypothetical protein
MGQQVPSVLTNASATFTGTLSGNTRSYQLTSSGLSSPASAARIHFAQAGVNGGVIAFLCGGGGKPACPSGTSGTITGTITATDIQAITDQGLVPADFAAATRAIQSGNTYVNVHTASFSMGEIRGQITAY